MESTPVPQLVSAWEGEMINGGAHTPQKVCSSPTKEHFIFDSSLQDITIPEWFGSTKDTNSGDLLEIKSGDVADNWMFYQTPSHLEIGRAEKRKTKSAANCQPTPDFESTENLPFKLDREKNSCLSGKGTVDLTNSIPVISQDQYYPHVSQRCYRSMVLVPGRSKGGSNSYACAKELTGFNPTIPMIDKSSYPKVSARCYRSMISVPDTPDREAHLNSSRKKLTDCNNPISVNTKTNYPKVSARCYRSMIQAEGTTTLNIPRMKFDIYTLSCENLEKENQDKLDELLKLCNSAWENTLTIRLSQFKNIFNPFIFSRLEPSGTTKSNEEKKAIKYRLWSAKMESFQKHKHIWYKYWKIQAGVDFETKYLPSITRTKLQELFPLYLFYVEMILTIIPRPEEVEDPNNYSYTEELEEASLLFLQLENPFLDPLNASDELWTERKAKLSLQIDLSLAQRPQVLWLFLDLWIRDHYPELWRNQLKKDHKSISNHAKGFLNYVFCFSIDRLVQYYQGLIPET
jgi:hypothetical protein